MNVLQNDLSTVEIILVNYKKMHLHQLETIKFRRPKNWMKIYVLNLIFCSLLHISLTQ
jgi:hypothetical protein